MASSIVAAGAQRVTGINVFTLPRGRHAELIDTLRAINAEIVGQGLPMIVSANFHRATEGRVVLNYNQYTDRENLHVLRSIPGTAALRKRTHDLSETHEIRWYEAAEIVTADPAAGELSISDDGAAVAVIGIFTAKPGRQDALLALLRHYGQALAGRAAPGFIGMATHRGFEAAHVASYEAWRSADAYRAASRLEPVAAIADRFADAAESFDRQVYEVVEVARFDLERQARARGV